MSRLRPFLRRPSAPMLVALLALFVALGGPAEAKRFINGKLLKRGSVTSRQVKDHTLTRRDLSKKTVRRLERTPRGSVNEAAIRNGAVTPGKLAPGAVNSTAIADRAVQGGDIGLGAVGSLEVADGSLTGADIADGGLDARDFARFWGRFTIGIPAIEPRTCWHGEPVGLAPQRSGTNIQGDVILVTPAANWPDVTPQRSLTFAARASATRSFTLMACNPTDTATIAVPAPPAGPGVTFNYVILHLP